MCGFSAGPQDNWLITQLINRTVNGIKLPQVSVIIEFEQRGCDASLNSTQIFNTHIYETFSLDTAGRRNVTLYRQVKQISSNITTGAKTIDLNFYTNHSSFYFAIRDETTCIVITRLVVFYKVCEAQTINLIHYPETIAGPSSPYEDLSNISVPATCIENAQPENGLAPLVACSADGVWMDSVPWPGVGCQCIQGYFRETFNDSETCKRKAYILEK